MLVAVAIAMTTARADRECLRRLEHSRAIDARLEGDAAPGGVAPAVAGSAGCRVIVRIQVARGSAPAGARVRALGDVSRTGDRLLVREAALVVLERPSLAAALRARTGRQIDSLFGSDAPLARALLIADARSVAAEVRQRFSDAGIIHMLSVSGLHVAIIAGAAELLLAVLRVPRRRAQLVALALIAGYVALLGFPAPALRSGVMLGVGMLTRILQRPTSPWAVLALGAFPSLVDPRTVLDIGYQLSVGGIAGLIASGALARRVLAPRLSGWRLLIARDLLASTVASLVTLPIVAWIFGRASLIAPFTNLAAGPIFGVLQPMLFLVLALAPLGATAHIAADGAHALLLAIDALCRIAAAVPYAAVQVSPTLLTAFAMGGAVIGSVVACVSRDVGRPLIAAFAAIVIGVWGPMLRPSSGVAELHMLDVGQGDALLLRTPRGRWIVFDAGRAWRGGDAGRSTVVPYLRRRGGDVTAFVLSHPHADHAGGAAAVLRATAPATFWDPGYVAPSGPYRAALEEAKGAAIAWRRVHPRDSVVVDGVRVTFLAPDSVWASGLADPNAASTVALVQYGRVRFLLVGDAERGEEAWLLAHQRELLRADVLKVGHHGSRTSSTTEFLDAVRPRLALISVGAGNTYGHPSPVVLQELRRRGTYVLRSDHAGTVVVQTDGSRLIVEEEGGRWVVSDGSSRR